MATEETGGLLTGGGITLTTLFINILLPPSGVSDSMPQNIGFATYHGFSRIQFSNKGNKMIALYFGRNIGIV
jgi:hypothetical protein